MAFVSSHQGLLYNFILRPYVIVLRVAYRSVYLIISYSFPRPSILIRASVTIHIWNTPILFYIQSWPLLSCMHIYLKLSLVCCMSKLVTKSNWWNDLSVLILIIFSNSESVNGTPQNGSLEPWCLSLGSTKCRHVCAGALLERTITWSFSERQEMRGRKDGEPMSTSILNTTNCSISQNTPTARDVDCILRSFSQKEKGRSTFSVDSVFHGPKRKENKQTRNPFTWLRLVLQRRETQSCLQTTGRGKKSQPILSLLLCSRTWEF